MSDPNYEHPFMPNRKGLCKFVLKDRHCGEPEDDIRHLRWAERRSVVAEPTACDHQKERSK